MMARANSKLTTNARSYRISDTIHSYVAYLRRQCRIAGVELERIPFAGAQLTAEEIEQLDTLLSLLEILAEGVQQRLRPEDDFPAELFSEAPKA